MSDRKIKLSYYLFNFLHMLPISLVFTTYVIFLQDNNMSSNQIGWINAAFMLTMFILEIPTGIVADIFGRKTSVVLGNIFFAFGPLIYFLTETFVWFVLAEISLGIGACFVSGAIDAWMKDSLDQNGNDHNLTHIMSNKEIFFRLTTVVGGVIGSVIAIYDLRILWLIATISQVIATIFIFFIIEEKYFIRKKLTFKNAMMQMKIIAMDSFHYGIKNKKIFYLMIAFGIFAFACQPLNQMWAPEIKNYFGIEALSYFWILMNVALAAGAILTRKISGSRMDNEKIMILSSIISGISIFGGAITGNIVIIFVGFFVNEFGRGMYAPACNSSLQNYIPSDKRATLGSFMSMLQKLGSASGWLLASFVHNFMAFHYIWAIAGLVFLIPIFFLRKIKHL